MADFPGTARDDAAVFHSYDKIYVGTGMEVGWGLTNDWYAYSMATEEWEPVAPLPAGPRQYCSGFKLGDERGYLFGGLDDNGPLSELWRYDPLTDTWTQRASLPAAGRYAASVITTWDHAYVCGGMLANGEPTNEVWRYDHASNTWSPRAPMPGPPRHRAAVVDNVVAGGADADFNALGDVHAYNFLADTWTPSPDLPEPRFGAASAEHMLLCGASALDEFHNTVFSRDWITGEWNSWPIPPFPGGPRKGGVASTQGYLMDIGILFYGLGINGQDRYKDWWMLVYGTGVAETTAQQLRVYPNPASANLHLLLPDHWPGVVYRILDTTGREVMAGHYVAGGGIGIESLAPGRYAIDLEQDGDRLRASFIKLP